MRLPDRKSQQHDADTSDDVVYLTESGVEKLKRELERIETHDLPQALEAMRFALTLGDFSENAEYQEAKPKLARLQTRILTIKDRLKRAIIIKGDDGAGRVQMGSRVTVAVNGKERIYALVGPQEANPSQGRISHLSPVGAALLNKTVGATVRIDHEHGSTEYVIKKIE